MSLEKMLANWLTHGLITREQALQIASHEKQKSHRPWILYGFLALGASIIGLGIISLIAANWKNLSNEIKLLWDFLLLFFVAKGIYGARIKGRPMLFEILLILFMILVLASIGLISQIYHVGGEFWQALLLWSGITALLAMMSTHFFVPFLWMGGLFMGLYPTLQKYPFFPAIQNHTSLILMSLPPLFFLLRILRQQISKESKPILAMNVWIVLSSIVALAFLECRWWDYHFNRNDPPTWEAFIPSYILMLLSACWIWIKSPYHPSAKYLLLLAMDIYIIPFHFPLLGINSEIAYALFSLSFLMAMTAFFSSLQTKKFFHLFLVLTGIRFLILYFQAIGGLAATGWGLITAGILIILMMAGWKKWIEK